MPREPYPHSGWMVSLRFSPGHICFQAVSYFVIPTFLQTPYIEKPLVPALDHLPLAHGEAEWLSAVVGCIELAAVALEGATVMHIDGIAGLGLAIALRWGDDLGLEMLCGGQPFMRAEAGYEHASLLMISAAAAVASARRTATFMIVELYGRSGQLGIFGRLWPAD